jgi:hypothetical protein
VKEEPTDREDIHMRKTLAALLSAGALLAPASTLAAPGTAGPHHARAVARQQCTSERRQLGVKAFRVKYGAPKALSNCVKAHLPGDRKAATTCRAERKQLGARAFRLKFGGPASLNRCIEAQATA